MQTYDTGGWLPAGPCLVENRSRRVEAILTLEQWGQLGGRSDADITVISQDEIEDDED